MTMGRRNAVRPPQSLQPPLYNGFYSSLAEAGFDRWIEGRCQPYYEQVETRGQRLIPLGVCFRMLLSGKMVGGDSTTLEADAAMKSIVRRDTAEGWKAYVVRLMREEGVIAPDEEPSDEDARRFDRNRKDKMALNSNEEWVSATDPAATIAKAKDGTTQLTYKAKDVVDLETDLIPAAEIRQADDRDPPTLVESVLKAEENLQAIGCEQSIEEVAADKGYHSVATLEQCQSLGLRTYIPEPKRNTDWTWTDKTPEDQRAVLGNRQRVRRAKGKQLQKRRSEVCERSFAHVCETGGMRRNWRRGVGSSTASEIASAETHSRGGIARPDAWLLPARRGTVLDRPAAEGACGHVSN